MKMTQIPYGVQEYNPEECYKKQSLENLLLSVFNLSGYDTVETPALEYYGLFEELRRQESLKKMFKLTDYDGSLLVLRPDVTVQAARMAVPGMSASDVKKICYRAESFEFLTGSAGARTREFAQVGVELFGKTDRRGDAEIIILAIESLIAAGLKDFLIDIGHIDFFLGIAGSCGLSEEESQELMRFINNKDTLGAEMFISGRKDGKELSSLVHRMTTLFGGREVLENARAVCSKSNKRSLAAIDAISYVLDAVDAAGYGDYVSVDLGFLKGDYYSGIVFKGMSREIGMPILDGGRYDSLAGRFQEGCEAVGFAIGVNRLLSALSKSVEVKRLPPCDAAYIALSDYSRFEHTYIASLKKSGSKVIKLFTDSKTELIKYAKERGIKRAFVIENEKAVELI